MTQTLWALLRKHKLGLTTAQRICNDALVNGVTAPQMGEYEAKILAMINRIEALEAALSRIAYAPEGGCGPTLSESIKIARDALEPERDK